MSAIRRGRAVAPSRHLRSAPAIPAQVQTLADPATTARAIGRAATAALRAHR